MNTYAVMKPIQNDDADTASFVQGPIQPAASRTVETGADEAHPELAADHPDAVITRIASAETDGEFTAYPDASNPHRLEEQGGGAFLDADHLATGGAEGEKACYPYSEHA